MYVNPVSGLEPSNVDYLEAELLRDLNAVEKLKPEWDQLLDQTSYQTIYSMFDYCLCGWKHFHAADSSLFVVAIRDNGKLVAVFPLRLETAHIYVIKYKLLSPVHTTETDKPYPLIAVGYESSSWMAFSNCLRANSKDWDILNWKELPDEFQGAARLKRAFDGFERFKVESRNDAFGPMIDLDQTWEEFLSKHRKLRQAISRINSKLGEDVHFKVYRTVEEVNMAIGIYIAIEHKGWKAGKIGVGRDSISRDFYYDLADILAKNHQIRIGVLYHKDKPVSAEITYTSGDRVFFSHGTYDPEYKHVSPGKISTSFMIKEFLADEFQHGDFLAGFSHYLSPWSDGFMTTTEVYVYNRRLVAHAIWIWRKIKAWLKEAIKRNPNSKRNISVKKSTYRIAQFACFAAGKTVA